MADPSSKQPVPPGLRLFLLLCAGLLLVDFLPLHYDGPAGWRLPWGFFGIFGFTACVLLVVAAKGLRRLVMRREGYYGDREGES